MIVERGSETVSQSVATLNISEASPINYPHKSTPLNVFNPFELPAIIHRRPLKKWPEEAPSAPGTEKATIIISQDLQSYKSVMLIHSPLSKQQFHRAISGLTRFYAYLSYRIASEGELVPGSYAAHACANYIRARKIRVMRASYKANVLFTLR